MRFVGALLVTALFCLVGCGATSPPAAVPRAPAMGDAQFTIQTYNLHREKSADTETIEAVGGGDADVLCLQEVTAAWEKTLRARYAAQYPYMLFAPKENAGGLAVLSHFPLEDHGVVPVPGDLHPGWIVHVATPAGRVQLVHVHLRSLFNGTRDWISNYFATGKDHVAETKLFLAHADRGLPTIVAGDFNESPRGAAVKLLEGQGFANVLPSFRPRAFTWYAKTFGFDMTIDHVMVDPSFEPLDAWVETRGGSDHLPVIAHVALRSP